MGIVCNHTGLMPAAAAFHAPHARVTELCDIFALQEAGGMLNEIDLSSLKNIKVLASSAEINTKYIEKIGNF